MIRTLLQSMKPQSKNFMLSRETLKNHWNLYSSFLDRVPLLPGATVSPRASVNAGSSRSTNANGSSSSIIPASASSPSLLLTTAPSSDDYGDTSWKERAWVQLSTVSKRFADGRRGALTALLAVCGLAIVVVLYWISFSGKTSRFLFETCNCCACVRVSGLNFHGALVHTCPG